MSLCAIHDLWHAKAEVDLSSIYIFVLRNAIVMQGVWLRDYETNPQRQNRQIMGDTLGEVAPSNAYKRRIAGANWS